MSNETIVSGCEDRVRLAGYSTVFAIGAYYGIEITQIAIESFERFSISQHYATVEGVLLFGAGLIIFRFIGGGITLHSNDIDRQCSELKGKSSNYDHIENIRAMDRYFYTVKLVDFNIRLIGAFLMGLGSGLFMWSTA